MRQSQSPNGEAAAWSAYSWIRACLQEAQLPQRCHAYAVRGHSSQGHQFWYQSKYFQLVINTN